MHPKSTATQAPVLDRLPSSQPVWRRREPQPVSAAYDLDACYVLTQQGREGLARERAIEAPLDCARARPANGDRSLQPAGLRPPCSDGPGCGRSQAKVGSSSSTPVHPSR